MYYLINESQNCVCTYRISLEKELYQSVHIAQLTLKSNFNHCLFPQKQDCNCMNSLRVLLILMTNYETSITAKLCCPF